MTWFSKSNDLDGTSFFYLFIYFSFCLLKTFAGCPETRHNVDVVCRHSSALYLMLLDTCSLHFPIPCQMDLARIRLWCFRITWLVCAWGFTAALSELLIRHPFYRGRSLLTLVSHKYWASYFNTRLFPQPSTILIQGWNRTWVSENAGSVIFYQVYKRDKRVCN